MSSYTRRPYKINKIFLKTLAGVCEISEIFLKTLTPSPTTLYHMIGCHKEGEREVFNSLQIVTKQLNKIIIYYTISALLKA